MSTLLNEARRKATKNFDRIGGIPNQIRQKHENDCVTTCLYAVSDWYRCEAPADGLAWNETLVMAAHYRLYLSQVFDTTYLPINCVLLAMHVPTKTENGHAYLILIEDGEPAQLFDPADGSVKDVRAVELPEWTHLAIVYSL